MTSARVCNRSPSATSMLANRCGGSAASVLSAEAATSAENTLAMSDCNADGIFCLIARLRTQRNKEDEL